VSTPADPRIVLRRFPGGAVDDLIVNHPVQPADDGFSLGLTPFQPARGLLGAAPTANEPIALPSQ